MSFVAVTMVLLVIMLGNVLARSLTHVTEGAIAPDMLLALVGVRAIRLMVTLLPLGMYLGILLAHGKLYRDHEMAVMQACGVSWLDLLRPTIVLGLLGVGLILMLTVFASPWAARYEEQLKQQMSEQSAVGFLVPGRFVESDGGQLVLFVGDASEDKRRFFDVFVQRMRSDQAPAVDIAEQVSYRRDEQTGDEYMVFERGQTTVGGPTEEQWIVTDFEKQGLLRPRRESAAPALRARAQTLRQLLKSGEAADLAELQWRVSIPLAALLLAMLAVPLAYSSPREGRFGRIVVAILLYIPYANLLVLARKQIAAGALPPWIGLWPIHLLLFALFTVLLMRRQGWRQSGIALPAGAP